MGSLAIAESTINHKSFSELELVVERGFSTFLEVGGALLEIRERRLYREDYGTFEHYCRERWGFSKSHANRLISAAELATDLTPMGVKIDTERQARKIATPNVENSMRDVTPHAVSQDPPPEIPETTPRNPEAPEDSDEWGTPPEYIKLARAVMGSIDLDPASNQESQKIVRADGWHGKKTDGLMCDWYGRVWLNPPYSQPLCQRFVAKLVKSFEEEHSVSQAVLLVNAATDTLWFQHLLSRAYLCCFVKGRISFLGSNGKPVQGNRYASAFFFLGCNPVAVQQEFLTVGSVVGLV